MAERRYGIPVGHRPGSESSPTTNIPRNARPLHYDYMQPSQVQQQPYQRGSVQNSPQPAGAQPTIPHLPPPPPQHYLAQSSPPQPYRNSAMAAPNGGYYEPDSYNRDGRAIRDIDNLFGGPRIASPSPEPQHQPFFEQHQPQQQRQQQQGRTQYQAYSQPARPYSNTSQRESVSPERRPRYHQPATSQSSIAPLMAAPAPFGQHQPSPPPKAMGVHGRQSSRDVSRSPPRMTPMGAGSAVGMGAAAPAPSSHGLPSGRIPRAASYYHGDGYDDGYFNPADIADDGDDTLEASPPRQSNRSSRLAAAPLLASMRSSSQIGKQEASQSYNTPPMRPPGGGSGTAFGGNDPEKSDWLQKQSTGSKRLKWIIGIVIAVVGIAAIAGGIAGGILSKNGGGGSSPSSTHRSDQLYDINSDEVKKVLNNKNLHRVFPGIDYTPLNAQYPACLTNPPDQNNVTIDVALLSQLSPSIRLYGTDCNQTEMVLEAIDRLGYTNSVKVWLGVWLDQNTTTSTRQVEQMYTILNTYPADRFAGIIVGNEVLFRKDLTEAQLAKQLQDVRNKLNSKGVKLPVATSDLGDDWTAQLAQDSDIVMANIHPFFAGTTAEQSASWAWTFWQGHDVPLAPASTSSGFPKHIISEIGWPSEGGNDCGTNVVCPNSQSGAVASIDNMNTFMDGWVCPSMKNGTTYFWFEAFDEPWKVIFNTDTDKWESKWGLFDSDRKLKPNLKIPDCGQTLDKPY